MFKKLKAAKAYLEHGDDLARRLVPDDAVVLDAPSDAARPAIDAALDGAYEPAAELLRSTREDQAWEDRDLDVASLGRLSLRSPQWLDAWREVDPDDPDLAVVDARRLVEQAWEQRSHNDASQVSAEQFAAFRETLEQRDRADPAGRRRLPRRPGPVGACAAPRARDGGRPGDLRGLPRRARARPTRTTTARATRRCSTCAPSGSARTRRCSSSPRPASTPPRGRRGSRRCSSTPSSSTSRPTSRPSPATRDRVEEAIARARGFLDANPDAGHHLTAQTRNVLARILFHLERHREAYEQLQAIGPYATSYPWRYWGDAREEFLTHRSHIVTLAAGAS